MLASTAGHVGGPFNRQTVLIERLRQAPGEEARQVVAVTAAGPAPSRWTLRTIRATFDWLRGYSLSGVWRVLSRADLRLRSARVQHYSPHPEYAAKVAHLQTCLREAAARPDEIVAVFLDEMGYYRWPAAAPDWGTGVPQPAPPARSVGTNQQWRIIGALNAMTGRVDYLDSYIAGRRQLSTFYQRLDRAYATARCGYVVQDNWSVHQHPDMLATLATLPRLQVVWLPTCAPWLNPIEKVRRWLRQDVLKLHRLAQTWPGLRQRVRAFLDQFAAGSTELLRYVGLLGEGKLAQTLRGP